MARVAVDSNTKPAMVMLQVAVVGIVDSAIAKYGPSRTVLILVIALAFPFLNLLRSATPRRKNILTSTASDVAFVRDVVWL